MPRKSRKLLTDDLPHLKETKAFSEIRENSALTQSYALLLIGSTIICTLGLLLGNAAIVIGGMIIAPLMWPLLRVSLGISYNKRSQIQQGLYVLLLSILVGLVVAYLITLISPLKIVNSEILSRTQPTLLDLVIALVAGTIGASAILKPRISQNLAGVAVATSLMPPLCVSGIGLALANVSVFVGGLVLFFSNIISILFATIFVFSFLGQKRHPEDLLRRKGVIIVAITLAITAVPLFLQLRSYSFRTVAYSRVEETLKASLANNAYLADLGVIVRDSDIVAVDAEIWLPEGTDINYKQQQEIIRALEETLHRSVDLNLRLQTTLSIVSEQSLFTKAIDTSIRKAVRNAVENSGHSFTIDSIQTHFNEATAEWEIDVVVKGDPSTIFSHQQRKELESAVSEETNEQVALSLEIIPRISLQSAPEVLEGQISKVFESKLKSIANDTDLIITAINGVEGFNSNDEALAPVVVSADVRVPQSVSLTDADLILVKESLETEFSREFFFKLTIIEKDVRTY